MTSDTTRAEPASIELLTMAEACRILRISKWSLYRLIQANELPTIKIGTRRLVRASALRDLLQRLTEEQT